MGSHLMEPDSAHELPSTGHMGRLLATCGLQHLRQDNQHTKHQDKVNGYINGMCSVAERMGTGGSSKNPINTYHTTRSRGKQHMCPVEAESTSTEHTSRGGHSLACKHLAKVLA